MFNGGASLAVAIVLVSTITFRVGSVSRRYGEGEALLDSFRTRWGTRNAREKGCYNSPVGFGWSLGLARPPASSQ